MTTRKSWSEFYQLDPAPIGRGGQAEVFRAIDRATGATLAVKRLLDPGSQEACARMKREVQVQLHLDHARVMRIIRHAEDFSWYSMPLARRSLQSLSPPLPVDQIVEIVSAGLEALTAAHEHRYVHRDITPTNILDLGLSGPHWVIADWGLVRRHEQTTVTRTSPGEFGTPGFAAPELWLDAHSADERADIYSLGRVVAWAATGAKLIPNVALVPEGQFAAFVRSTTALRPEDRPAGAAAALQLLDSLMSPRPKSSVPSTGPLPDVIAAIRASAQAQFPDDYSTQKYVIQKETEAWRRLDSLSIEDLPPDVVATITSQAATQFPEDFSTRIYVIEKEANAWRQLQTLNLPLPTAVFERIVAKAQREFPHDYSTRLYVIQQQAQAWTDLHS
jgi:serine/threonine protein kinase